MMITLLPASQGASFATISVGGANGASVSWPSACGTANRRIAISIPVKYCYSEGGQPFIRIVGLLDPLVGSLFLNKFARGFKK